MSFPDLFGRYPQLRALSRLCDVVLHKPLYYSWMTSIIPEKSAHSHMRRKKGTKMCSIYKKVGGTGSVLIVLPVSVYLHSLLPHLSRKQNLASSASSPSDSLRSSSRRRKKIGGRKS